MAPKLTPEQETAVKRAIVFKPCKTKQHLQDWLREFLNVDLPDTIVDPNSNSCPLDLIWEIYEKAIDGHDENFQRILAFAARDSYKSFAAAVLEVLMVVHLDRDVAHMAAQKPQAIRVQRYVKKFLSSPFLKPYVVAKNDSNVSLVRYMDANDMAITEKEWSKLPSSEQVKYRYKSYTIEIVVATVAGANCVDPSTLITMADGSEKRAAEVRPGDRIRNFDTSTGEPGEALVKNIGTSIKPRLKVCFEDGSWLVLSEDHKLFTRQGWRAANTLLHGTDVFSGPFKGPSREASVGELRELPVNNPRQVLLGTLLGDASLSWPRNKDGVKYGRGPRLKISHSAKQKDYARWKSETISRLGFSFSFGIGRNKLSTEDQHSYQSQTSELLAEVYKELYPEDKKTITKNLLAQLDEEALAYWLMDDVSGNSEQRGLRKDHVYRWATCCFSLEENLLIVEWLKERWDLNATVESTSNQSGKSYPCIELDMDSSRRLSALVEPFFGTELRYKLVPTHENTQGWCIYCGIVTDRSRSGRGQAWCEKCLPVANLKEGRDLLKRLKELPSQKVVSVSTEEDGLCVDLILDVQEETQRNFFANGKLAHNSAHVSFMCIDELDVMPNKVAYEEAKAIPAPRDGKLPITFLTSSRKFSFGLVQTEIDEAKKTGTHIRNWNIIDVTARCPEKRHLPLLPKIPIWVDEEELSAISDEEYKSKPPGIQARYVEKSGFQGCLSNCKAFSYCQGRLAEANRAEQGDFLKPIASVQQSIRQASLNMANAQYLCKKPSSEGLVYTHFDITKHCKYPWQIKEMISDEPADRRMTKEDLLKWLKTVEGGRWFAGYDWGFTHNFVAVLGFKYGYNLYVVDAVVEAGLDAVEKVEACDKRGWKALDPVGFPDPESPSEIKTFKKAGYIMKEWDKGSGSVLAGIEVVRTKLRPGHGREPQLYFLTVDPNNGSWEKSEKDPDSEGTIWSHQHYVEDAEKEDLEIVIRSHQLYHWKQDKAQRSTKEPDEEGADECDATRYMTMNVFPIKKDTTSHAPTPEQTAPAPPRPPSFWEQISAEVGVELGKTEREAPTTKRKGKWFISE